MKLPAEILPLLEKAASEHSLPVELWKGNDRNRIKDAFSSLAVALYSSELDLRTLPKGYGLILTIFNWERERLFEGWNAFHWISEPTEIVQAYAEVGLAEESRAIESALGVWLALTEDETEQDETEEEDSDDAMTAVYEEARHAHSDHGEQISYIVDYFCTHANKLFYESELST